jgi:hypothetical protein
VQPQQRGGIPAGTQLVVTTSEAIDCTRPGSYHGRLAQPVPSGQVIAAAQSEVLLTVSEQKTQGTMVYAELTVDTITAGGKTLPVMSQPMMRPISANGRDRWHDRARKQHTRVHVTVKEGTIGNIRTGPPVQQNARSPTRSAPCQPPPLRQRR